MNHGSQKNIYNLPNALTVIRLACIPLVMICLNIPGRWGGFLAALFFGMASITDILDGFFARRYGEVTSLGKFLDPLADKILICLTMIMLIPLGRIPVWMVLIIVMREMAVTGLRGIAISEGIVITASSLGKYKTLFQSIAVLGLCLHYTYLDLSFHTVGMAFLWVGLILAVWSGLDYLWKFRKVLVTRKQGK
jgi:CDP-diacylglycerol--glycerol-3-phosphate 3-phosphatidyltransferase